MRELPSGTVTFLFTDIEGSTRLLRDLGDAYADAVAEHRRVLRDVVAGFDGVEVDTQGDAFFFAFARARDGVAAAAAAQEALVDGQVRVRMGLHTGEPLLTEEGYVGIDVHRAARIAAVGQGGQILVSQSTRDLVPDVRLRDLGTHRLKDLGAPERIYQVGDEAFPPLRTLDRTNLPVAATALVGRRRELAELTELLRTGTKLVTITGAGGSGKTRLALQVAAELADDVRDGVFFVPLAPVRDASLVASTIAQTVGVSDLQDLRDVDTLLLLDNFEHLLGAANALPSLLTTAPGVKLLVTSRVRLRISGETEYELAPFDEPDAVEFFLERARSVRRDVRRGETVLEICRRLDSLPLALELAASRVKVLDPALLLERLGRRLPVLTGGSRDLPERQQTLRATLEWSYGLLESRYQRALARLGVFAGSFSLEAAEQVAEADLDELATLVDWSLVKPIGSGRFLLLETIREFALELLSASEELDEVRRRHLEFMLALVVEAEPKLTGPEQVQWYEQLSVEHDNVREALAYACASGDGERALMLAGSIWRFWWNRGYTLEAAQWYERSLALRESASQRAVARGVFGAAHVAEMRGDAEQTLAAFEEAAQLLRESGETRWVIPALAHLGFAYQTVGQRERGRATLEECLELATQTRDVRGVALANANLGGFFATEGDEERALALYALALEDARAAGDTYLVASTAASLAEGEVSRGETAEAADHIAESIRLSGSIGDTHTLAETLATAADVLFTLGDADTATLLYGCCHAVRAAYGLAYRWERDSLQERAAAARETLGERFEGLWARGAELDIQAAVERALAALVR
jgi:predicted ATPase/class 3 adenylate cyclase